MAFRTEKQAHVFPWEWETEISWVNWGWREGGRSEHGGLGRGQDSGENNERDVLIGGHLGLGGNLVPGKLLGIHKDDPS